MLFQAHHRLSRSRLRPSLLRTRFTTPSLKKRSSPPAVRPPMYHLSAPLASRNPSLELSLPRRRPPGDPLLPPPPPPPGLDAPGIGRGECSGSWFITLPPVVLPVPAAAEEAEPEWWWWWCTW